MNLSNYLRLAFSLLTLTSSVCLASPAGNSQQLTSPDQVPEGLAKSDWTSIRAAYEAGRHAFQPIEGGWQARNPGQQWTTKFDGRGFVSEPKGGGWQWGLELKRYGFPGATRAISGVPLVNVQGQRLTYDWDSVVQEWWVNDARGLEHGFTVRERPAAGSDTAAPLQFELAVRGSLTAQIAADGLGVLFRDAAGNTVINYSGLKVWDVDGKILASRFKPVDPSTPTVITLEVNERGARYPLTIDPIAQQAYLKPAAVGTTQAGDRFGVSVAVSGDTVVVGAWEEDSGTTGVNSTPNENAADAGAAYVFVRSGTRWSQQAYLKASNAGASDNFGRSVAVSGDTVVVGAYGEDSSSTGVNSTPNENASDAGAAYVFVRSGTNWSQQAYLKASNTGEADQFGFSVAISGDTAIVGANAEDSSTTGVNSIPDENARSAGAAYVFVRNGTNWLQQAYLKANNTGASDVFGGAVAVSGDTVVVGAYGEDSSSTGVNSTPNENASGAGAAYVFVRSGTNWSQQGYFKASNTGTGYGFGYSVGVSGDTVVVGAYWESSSTTGVNSTPNENAPGAGAAYVFVRSGTNWTQQSYLKASNTGAYDYFALSVAVEGDTVVIGAYSEDSGTAGVNSTPNEGAPDAGAAYVFTRSGTTWGQKGYLKASNTGAIDSFGYSVGVSGDMVVVGSYLEDSSTMSVNSTPDELATDAGAVYVFTGFGPAPEIAMHQPTGNDLVDGAALIDFGFVPLGGNSAPKTFTITNVGNATLTLTNITEDGFHPGDFAVGSLGQNSLAPGASTTFSVTFSPAGYGSRSAAIHIASNDGDENPFDVVLTGAEGTNQFQWARRVASTTNPDDELAIGMTVDSSGNAYVTGWFDRTNDFGGVTLTNKSGGGQDIFVAKYSSTGTLQWARRAGGSTSRPDAGRGVGVDNAGNVYVTGGFHGTADFGGITRIASDLGEYFSDFFLARYDNAGTVQWVQQSVGGFGVYGTGLAVDGAGNSYAVGYAENAAGFSFGPINLINTNLNGYSAFLVKYDNAGTPQWATLMGGTSNTYATKVAVDGAGNIYVCGSFLGNMRIGTSNLVASSQSDMFFAKFNNSGALTWVRQTGGSGLGEGGIAADLAGNVYVSGAFGGNPANFDGILLTNAGSYDAFLAKYNSSGVIQWARRAGGTDLDFYSDVAVDRQGNVYPVGALSSNAVAPNGSGGAMVAKYDAAGTLQWAHSGSGLPASPVGSVSAKSAVDPVGNAYLAGWYRTPTTFGTNVLQTNGFWNYFLAKLPAPTIPLKFDNLSVSNGNFTVRLVGVSGISVAVDTSTNLTSWTAWQTNTLTNGSWNLLVPMGTNRQFFRGRLP